MKNKLLVVLAVIGLLAMITIPFATPVMAADTLTSITTSSYTQQAGVPSFITSSGINTTYFGVTFTGSFSSLPTNTDIKAYSGGVQDATITFGNIAWVVPNTSFNADIIVGAAAHGPRDVTVLASNILYSGLLVAEFPYPPVATSQVNLSLTPYYDALGGSNITSPGDTQITTSVSANTTIWYKLTLSQESSSAVNYMGGQLAVKFPHNPAGTTFIHVAGYGAGTSAHPDIPEIKPGSPFSAFSPQAYTANPADRDASGYLIAQADYGNYTHDPQIDGTIEGQGPTRASASTTITTFVPPVPELPAGLLFGMGLLGLGGFVMAKRHRDQIHNN